MKKNHNVFGSLFSAAIVLIGVVACNAYAKAEETSTSSKSRTLVVFFSRAGEQYNVGNITKGNTALVAEEIANQTGADLFEVKPKEDVYPKSYDALTDYAKKEQSKKARPEYVGKAPDLKNYDVVFIGAPVWWGDWPMIMYSFFEKNDLAGKQLAPFCTHEGSGLSAFDKKLQKACPKSKVLKGLAITGSTAQKDRQKTKESVSKWLDDLKIKKATVPEKKAVVQNAAAVKNVSNDKTDFDKENVFGQGALNTEYAKYFIGNSYLKSIVPQDCPLPVANVTFEPGCRNNWHIHHASKDGGQLLICTAGEGWYQEEGKDPVELKPGVTVYIPAEIKHWHGAKKDKWFSHIAISIPGEDVSNEWLEPVDDESYNKLP